MKSNTEKIIGALRILVGVIKYERRDASAKISEAADHMGELAARIVELNAVKAAIRAAGGRVA